MERRERLKAARLRLGLSQEDLAERIGVSVEAVGHWERGKKLPYPIHVRRLSEIFGATPEDLGLAKDFMIPTTSQTAEEILNNCAAGIDACGTLSDSGGHRDIAMSHRIIVTYVPMLTTIMQNSSKYREYAAVLLSRLFQMRQRLAYHTESVEQALVYSQRAVEYAKESQDATMLIMALRELASVYEWPLDHIPLQARRKKALELTDEGVFLMAQNESISPLVASWVHIGHAKFQAFTGLKQEAYHSIGKAQEAFTRVPASEEWPGFHLDEANLIRQESIVYAYLDEHSKALSSFDKIINLNDSNLPGRLPMPVRTHLGTLSEAIISLLKLPFQQKDKELALHIWHAEYKEALALQSKTYLNESYISYRIMEALWPDDARITDLRDLI